MGLSDFRNAIITEDKFSGTFRKFDSTVQGSARGLDKLGGLLSGGGLGMLFGATAGIAGAVGIAKTTWELGQLGAQSITTRNSFETLMQSVGQSPALLNQMKAAAGGTVTELKLMQSANTALAGTSGQLSTELAGAIPKLIEAGRAAAMLNPSMGDAAFMTQSLITGIKRGSPMLIDNTGITLKLGEATEAYAKSVGKSVTELTAQERSIAILRATLSGADTLIQQTGGNLDSMTSDMQRASVAVEELKVKLAEAFAPTVANAAGSAADALTRFLAITDDDEPTRLAAQIELLNEHIQAGGPIAAIAAGQVAQLQTRLSELRHSAVATARAETEAADAAENMRFMFMQGATASASMRDKIIGLAMSANAFVTSGQAMASTIRDITAAANSATGNYTGFLGGVDVFSQSQYVAITQQRIDLERALNTQVAAGILTQQQADYQLATFDKRVTDHVANLRDQGKAVADVASSYDDLKSKIGSALTPTFDLSNLTGGLLGGQVGDTFDEAYKRLAAVALRPEELQIHAGDWASTFEQAGLTGLTPEEAQARAKELVEAYSKGLDFSLIDKEKIKDSIRQGIKAEELYNAMVDEIYAEMGKERKNDKLGSAFYKLGQNGSAAATQALKDGAPGMVDAWVSVLINPLEAQLRQRQARYEQ